MNLFCSSNSNQCDGLEATKPAESKAFGGHIRGWRCDRWWPGDSHSVGGPANESGQQEPDGHRIGGSGRVEPGADCNDIECGWSKAACATIVVSSAGADVEYDGHGHDAQVDTNRRTAGAKWQWNGGRDIC